MNQEFVDLHVHTDYSDSTCSPEEVFQNAARLNLSAVAITDHDSVEGMAAATEAANRHGIELVPGIELTTVHEDTEIHVLGLLIEWQAPNLREQLSVLMQERAERVRKMLKELEKQGIKLEEEDVFRLCRKQGSIGRLHVARALLEKGAINNIKEAFYRFIGEDSPCFVQRKKVSPAEAVEIIRSVRGIPILAHPNTMKRDELIPYLIEQGIMGLEVYHPDNNAEKRKYYLSLVEKHNLLVSGGSDCHGYGKGAPSIGRENVPRAVLDQLKAAKKKTYPRS